MSDIYIILILIVGFVFIFTAKDETALEMQSEQVVTENMQNHKWWHGLFGYKYHRIIFREGALGKRITPDMDETVYYCKKCNYKCTKRIVWRHNEK